MNRMLANDISRLAFSTATHSTIPLTSLSSLRFRHPVRPLSTEQRSTTSSPVPPPTSPSQTTAGQEVSPVPAPGSPPPLPPAPLDAITPKAIDLAEEKVQKEIAKKEKDAKPQGSLPTRAWAVVKKEAAHYWAGTKLLGHEIKISTKLLRTVLRGEELTRRERRQVCA